MNRNLCTIGALLVVTLAACGQGPTAPASRAESPADPAAELSVLVNQHRAAVGCPVLLPHGGIRDVAQSHSQDMATRGFFGHVNPDGKSPFDRLREAGISWTAGAAENLARARATPADILRGWLASPSHRAALENCAYTHHGAGVVGEYWTQLYVGHPAP